MHGTSVQVVSGYFAVKQAFLGRFVCTIACRRLSSWLALGVGFTFDPEGSPGAASPALQGTVVNTTQTPSILIVCNRPTPDLSIRPSRFHEGHCRRLKDYQIAAFALCPWSQGSQCPLWVKSRHQSTFNQRPLYPQKRTLRRATGMSALCQKQTFVIRTRAQHLELIARSRARS
jgi:hypothetical protein